MCSLEICCVHPDLITTKIFLITRRTLQYFATEKVGTEGCRDAWTAASLKELSQCGLAVDPCQLRAETSLAPGPQETQGSQRCACRACGSDGSRAKGRWLEIPQGSQ